MQNGVDLIGLLSRLHTALLLEMRRKHIIECLAASFVYPFGRRRQIDVQIFLSLANMGTSFTFESFKRKNPALVIDTDTQVPAAAP